MCVVVSTGCQTGAEAFVDDKVLNTCVEAYHICGVTAGCVLDNDHFVEGVFSGTRRVVVRTEERDVRLVVKIYLSKMHVSGTEILAQVHETDCTIDPFKGVDHRTEYDVFDKAGDDRILEFDLEVAEKGEHLLEIYSDATAEYLLVVKQR
jgi:hypothetical protein